MGRTDLPSPDLAPYRRDDIRFAVAAWPIRAAQELRSAGIFHALARAARIGGAPSQPWPSRFVAAVRDEASALARFDPGLLAKMGPPVGAVVMAG